MTVAGENNVHGLFANLTSQVSFRLQPPVIPTLLDFIGSLVTH